MVTGYLCWKRFFPPASYQLTRNRNVYLPELNQRGLGDWLEWIINHMQALTHLVTPIPCMLCSMPISFHVALREKMKIQNSFPTLLCTVLCAKLDSIKESKSTTPKKMLWYGQSITACLLYQQSMRLLTLCVIFTFLCLRSSLPWSLFVQFTALPWPVDRSYLYYISPNPSVEVCFHLRNPNLYFWTLVPFTELTLNPA